MPFLIDGEEFAPFHFYVDQMKRAIMDFETGRLADVGLPILSFFSGKEQHQPAAPVNPDHIFVFAQDKEMQKAVESNPHLFIRWTEVIYFYFLEMAAFSREAQGSWDCCWSILDMFELTHSTFSARCQMASWAAAYNERYAKTALYYLKAVRLSTDEDKAKRSLILSSRINEGQPDQLWHIKNAMALSSELRPVHKLQAYISYYCKIDASEEVLTYIISALNWAEMMYIREGKIGMLEPVIWTLQHNNNYRDLLFLLRCFRIDIRKEGFKSAHAFLLPNMSGAFVALKVNERIQLSTEGNGDNYVKLMRLCNRMFGVAVSIRGEEELGAVVETFEDHGKPSQDVDFEDLRVAIVDHYQLKDDFYRELSLITLVPSHNHPVQGALCSLGVVPPLLSTSLQDLVDEPEERRFVFLLARSTYTVDIESAWIKGKFGESADIRIDPKPEDLISALKDERLTHVYISAHGQFDHWERKPDRIHFSDSLEVEVDALRDVENKWKLRRTLILNLCDGAATRISYNPNNSGMAAALASGSQVVASHLWPVHPLYAAVFGMFLLDRLHSGLPCQEAVLNVYQTLSQDNKAIAASALKMGDFSKELATKISNTEFRLSDFRNIGAMAIYA